MKVRGFTLIEMVLTMVVGSILILGIAGFVELGSRGYADTVARQRIQTQARFVLEKMTREIRHAVPNSFDVTPDKRCLSFYPIVYSGFYSVDESDNTRLSFIIGNKEDDFELSDLYGLYMIINPTNQSEFSSDDKELGSENLKIDSDAMSAGIGPLDNQSIANRFYIYKEKVEYCIVNQEITRNNVQVADSISDGEFIYSPPTLQRGGVVHLALTIAQNGESSHFEVDAQVLNVP